MSQPLSDPGPPPGSAPAPLVPSPLRVAALVVDIEAALLGALTVFEIINLDRSRLAMGLTTTAFFALFGLALAWSARGLRRLQSTSRSLAVFAQFIALGVAWSFRGGATTWVAVALVLLAIPVLVGVFHPASIRAVEGSPED